MTKQLIKTFNGFAVTYHGDYKVNPFVITYHGKVVQRYGDFGSCTYHLFCELNQRKYNFERMGNK